MDGHSILTSVEECLKGVAIHEGAKIAVLFIAVVVLGFLETRLHLLSRIGLRINTGHAKRDLRKANQRFQQERITEAELNEFSVKYALMKHKAGNETGIKEFKELIPRVRLDDVLVQQLIDLARKHHPRSDQFSQLMKIICDEIASRRSANQAL